MFSSMQTITSFQKPQGNTCIVSGRVDSTVFSSMLSLISAAGYKDVNSFVREAVLSKCKYLAAGMADMYEDRLSSLATNDK